MIRRILIWVVTIAFAAILIVAMCASVWAWLLSWGVSAWILRRELGEMCGLKIVWCINILIVLLGGWKLRRVYGQWLWITAEKWEGGIIHEYACPLSIAAKEQEAIWHRERLRERNKKKNH